MREDSVHVYMRSDRREKREEKNTGCDSPKHTKTQQEEIIRLFTFSGHPSNLSALRFPRRSVVNDHIHRHYIKSNGIVL